MESFMFDREPAARGLVFCVGLAAAACSGSGGGQTNRQAVEELRPKFAAKAARLQELATKLPPPLSAKEHTLPKTLNPPLVYYYDRGKYDSSKPPATAKTLDFSAVEVLANPKGLTACGMTIGDVVRCINSTDATSFFATTGADKRDGVSEMCRPAVDIRYLAVYRVLRCGDVRLTGDKTFTAEGIDYEVFLADLETGTFIGQFSGHAAPPTSVTVSEKVHRGKHYGSVDSIKEDIRRTVRADTVAWLRTIPGTSIE
jgi:hypothetical protein